MRISNYWRIAVVLLVLSLSAFASDVDPVLVGIWSAEQSAKEGRKPVIIWKIREEGKLVMSFATVEKGTLTTGTERFGVLSSDNPNELFHGLYKVIGADSFLTNSSDSPGDWIRWTRVASDAKTRPIEECLLTELMNERKTEGHGNFNPALIGLWQTSMTDAQSRTQFAWRIAPDGKCTRVKVSAPIQELPIVTASGQIRVTTGDGTVNEMKYHLSGRDQLDVSDETQTLRLTRCGGQK